MNKYNHFEDFMQASINAANCELERKYGISILDIVNGSTDKREQFAKIVKSTVYGSQNYETRFKMLHEKNQDMDHLVNECASSIMLKVVLSNII